jgi:hypothetical protein
MTLTGFELAPETCVNGDYIWMDLETANFLVAGRIFFFPERAVHARISWRGVQHTNQEETKRIT